MSSEVVVAIVAACAALVGPSLVWLAARQQQNDARALIAKDLDLIERLRQMSFPETPIDLVTSNVDAQIDALVARDRRRRMLGKLSRWMWPGYVLYVASLALAPFEFPEAEGISNVVLNLGGLGYAATAYFIVVGPFYLRSVWSARTQ